MRESRNRPTCARRPKTPGAEMNRVKPLTLFICKIDRASRRLTLISRQSVAIFADHFIARGHVAVHRAHGGNDLRADALVAQVLLLLFAEVEDLAGILEAVDHLAIADFGLLH